MWSKQFDIRLIAIDGWFNRIRQVAAMFHPMRAHWRHLANTTELVLPSAHPDSTAQTANRPVQPFSHRSRKSIVGQIGATWRIRLNLCILRPTRVDNANGKSIGSAVFAHLTAESPGFKVPITVSTVGKGDKPSQWESPIFRPL